MDTPEKIFARNLRKLRKQHALTQAALADKIAYSEKAVSKWESGNAIPPTAALLRIADILDTTLDELFDHRGTPQYFLGIDGGATKTDFALTDAQGTILAREILGCCNPVDIGIENAKRVLEAGIRKVTKSIPLRKIAVFAGISGGGSGENPQLLRDFLEQLHFCRVGNGSDAASILAAGLRDEDGIAVIMGTGSVAFVQKNGVADRLGGFGYRFDNGGNGYSIGRDAIRAAMCAEDGTGDATLLRERVLEKLGAPSAIGAISDFYEMSKRDVATYAPMVVEACREGDRVAADILSRNMREIARLLMTGRKKLARDRVKVVLVGGLTHASDLLLPLIRSHLDLPDAYELTVYRDPPVYGALILARALPER